MWNCWGQRNKERKSEKEKERQTGRETEIIFTLEVLWITVAIYVTELIGQKVLNPNTEFNKVFNMEG